VNKLVVKSRNTYINGSTVLAPDKRVESPLKKEEYEKLKRSKVERINRVKQKKNAQKRKVMMSIACVFLVGFSLIWGEAQVYRSQIKLSDIKAEITETNKENEDLRLQLAKASSIDNIRSVAESNLHMIAPDRKLMIVADLNKDNFIDEPKDYRESKAKEIITIIKSLLF
jgi:cell division protein FtsL